MTIKNRKFNRLHGYDYTSRGSYFVTICTRDRNNWLGEIKNGKMILNQHGIIVKNQWVWLSQQYDYIGLDNFVVMPNHVHGILSIIGNDITTVGNGRDRSLHKKFKSLSELIGAFKTTSSKALHQNGLTNFQWQKSFHDHIIRDDLDCNRIREYIINNPSQWDNDEDNKKP